MSLRYNIALAMNWRAKQGIYMLLSIHNDTSVEIHRRNDPVQKLKCVHQYNLFVGGVDYNDQMMQPHLATRTHHWYKKVSIYLFIFFPFIIPMLSTLNPLKDPNPFSDIRRKLSLPLCTRKTFHQKPFTYRQHADSMKEIFQIKFLPEKQAKNLKKKCWVCPRGS